jgi:hypothetical protein
MATEDAGVDGILMAEVSGDDAVEAETLFSLPQGKSKEVILPTSHLPRLGKPTYHWSTSFKKMVSQIIG